MIAVVHILILLSCMLPLFSGCYLCLADDVTEQFEINYRITIDKTVFSGIIRTESMPQAIPSSFPNLKDQSVSVFFSFFLPPEKLSEKETHKHVGNYG